LLVVSSRLAFAEPKVAVAPLDGDDGKVAEVVGEIVSERAKLTKPGRVEGAMKSMGVGVLSSKSVKKLRTKLDVDVVVYGKLERDGRVKKLALTFAGKGKASLEIEFASDKSLRKELSGKVAKRISSAMEGGGDDDADEEEARAKKEEERKREEERQAERKKREEEEERKREEERQAERKKREDEERRKKDDDERQADRRKKKGDDDDRRRKKGDDEDDGDRRKKRVAEDDEDGSRARKRLGDEEDEEDEEQPRKKKRDRRHALTQSALWLDGGGAFARRTLTYAATGAMQPPPVGTLAPAGRIAGELYPAAFSSLDGAAAGFGIAGAYTRTFGLGIDVPGTTVTTPVKNGDYSVGARYRFAFGQHSLALGVSYWRRYYMADRTGLMTPDQLDMPDVDYTAVAPGLSLRVGATPKISAFATVDVPLVLTSGPIQNPASYGGAKIIAFDIRAGSQIIVADHVAIQIAAEVEQIGLKFTGQAGSQAATRMVSAATDRSIGVAATIGVTY
jgi:hypothetical protein